MHYLHMQPRIVSHPTLIQRQWSETTLAPFCSPARTPSSGTTTPNGRNNQNENIAGNPKREDVTVKDKSVKVLELNTNKTK
jgi:hypothetical protein